ncbi:MAG: tetratricopeptide repeat protein [Methanomassiliicoccales archaeon]|nr:tetratricopeptide repeat protein [Methanomassiliicoccales archaeon]
MQIGKTLLKPAAFCLIAGGILTIISSVIVFIWGRLVSTTLGTLIVIFFLLVAISEISVTRSLWRSEIGAWKSILTWVGLSLICRALIIYFSSGDIFYANSIIGAAELLTFVFVFTKKDYFIPSEAERAVAIKNLEASLVKTVSECPTCKGIVEKDWISCPYCGTSLPKICGKCGAKLQPEDIKCGRCGAEIERPELLIRHVETLKALAEEESSREVRSSRYAKLAEALLKLGRTNEALDAYRKAIEFTVFDRKKSHYMVKMATILKNIGKSQDALEIVEEALKLDPEDYAGATKVKEQILKSNEEREACQVGERATTA